jgi:hypothetical protein
MPVVWTAESSAARLVAELPVAHATAARVDETCGRLNLLERWLAGSQKTDSSRRIPRRERTGGGLPRIRLMTYPTNH